MLTFEIEYDDGTTELKQVPLTFDDVPGPVKAQIVAECDPSDLIDITARMLAWRLDVPLEASRRLIDELEAGEGVVVA